MKPKRLLPRKTEVAIFAVLALILASAAASSSSTDVMLAVLAMPLFVVSALFGMHRSGRLMPLRDTARTEPGRPRGNHDARSSDGR